MTITQQITRQNGANADECLIWLLPPENPFSILLVVYCVLFGSIEPALSFAYAQGIDFLYNFIL